MSTPEEIKLASGQGSDGVSGPIGSIALVGAGPGDPDLLTVRGALLIAAADVVVHDALVGTGVLALVSPDAELIDVGKRPGSGVPQELTNLLLMRLVGEGKRVVRLKGGDPFVFGRGGEEAIALAEAGIACEIVPGITSAVAAPAAAGIPITQRGMSAHFTVVTGHRQRGEAPINWRALAEGGGTLVVLMGVAQRAAIASALIDGGLASDTPVAAIERASTAAQTVARCRLDELGALDVDSPATLVIGAVAALDVTAIASTAALAGPVPTPFV
jgi:uroporphyrin-III C-methyltransferase